jgi:hypothetical protein
MADFPALSRIAQVHEKKEIPNIPTIPFHPNGAVESRFALSSGKGSVYHGVAAMAVSPGPKAGSGLKHATTRIVGTGTSYLPAQKPGVD